MKFKLEKSRIFSRFWAVSLVPIIFFSVFFVALCWSFEDNIPLYVINGTDIEYSGFPVRAGIPFSSGSIYKDDIANCVITDDQGHRVVSQFKPFVFWSKNESVKWLLVDFAASLKSKSTTSYFLTKIDKKQRENKLSVIEKNNEIIVNTGILQAVISRQRGTILESVFIDLNKNREFEPLERIIRPDNANGIHVTSDEQEIMYGKTNIYNMWGTGGGRIKNYTHSGRLLEHSYMSGLGKPDKVEVEASGPVRATVLIQGKHYPQKKDNGVKENGFYYYTTRLHFFSGKPFIKVEHSIDNNRKDFPMHIYQIKDMRLHFSLDRWAGKNVKYILGGEKENKTGKLSDNYIGIFQDSANLERWNLHSKLQNKSKEEKKKTPGYFYQSTWQIGPAKFRGYRIFNGKSVTSVNKSVGSGDHAPGWGGLYNKNRGISVYVNRFWEECPKAIVLGKASVDTVLFPGFSPENFQIHSGTRKNHTLYLNFSGQDYSADNMENFSRLCQSPPMLKSNSERYAKSLALPRAMGMGKKNDKNNKAEHWYPHAKWHRNIITARWKTTGLSTGFNQGGMHNNYWPIFSDYIQNNDIYSFERGVIFSKWASEAIPWLINDYTFTQSNRGIQHQLIGYGKKELFLSRNSAEIKGWVRPYKSNISGFSSPAKVYIDGEHLMHLWPYEWYYLTGSPIARDGLMAVGNQAKYSVHRNFFKSEKKYSGSLNPAPSLDDIFYFNDKKYPERIPWYFYTRIYSSHLISIAMTYAATGDEASLFYARWLVRRILYLQDKNSGILGEKKRWKSVPPWQESEAAIAAFELYKETGDEELLDIMGSWLEWAWHEAYVPGKGMPHRFTRGSDPKEAKKLEHHWYPGVAAPLCFVALGDKKALTLTKEWAGSRMSYIKKGEFLNKAVGQSASYVLNYIDKIRKDKTAPEKVSDLSAKYERSKRRLVLNWTAPLDKGTNSNGSAKKYWIKIADKPIVAHPQFPDRLDKETGFYHADNIKGEPLPKKAGGKEEFVIDSIAPHSAYGSDKSLKISEFKKGTYYLVLKSWDGAGNISSMSNIAEVRIQ